MLRLILIIPFLLALILFTASNQDPLDLWFVSYSWKSSAGILALIVATVAFLLGAFTVWVVELRQRRRARRAETQLKTLEAQLAELRQRVVDLPSAPYGGPTAGTAPRTPPALEARGGQPL